MEHAATGPNWLRLLDPRPTSPTEPVGMMVGEQLDLAERHDGVPHELNMILK